MIPTWLPVKLTAGTPRSARAIVSSAAETRSPVVSSMSISRPGRVVDTWEARAIRLSVALPIADTTTTTSWPWRLVICTFSATARMRSGSATEVPPYFWTIRATGARCYPWVARAGSGDSAGLSRIGTAQPATTTAMNSPSSR